MLPSLALERRMHAGASMREALDALEVRRVCCRRMLISHPNEVEDFMLMQKLEDVVDEAQNYTLKMVMRNEREVSTE